MVFKWYHEDAIPLQYIQHIPNVKGIATTLKNKNPGELWTPVDISGLRCAICKLGFDMDVVDNVAVHSDIKLGLPTREKYIENYKATIKNLSEFGVKVVCYNFEPLELDVNYWKEMSDGSNALMTTNNVQETSIDDIIQRVKESNGNKETKAFETLQVKELFSKFQGVTRKQLLENLSYFLKAILPTCEAYDVKMAISMAPLPCGVLNLPVVCKDRESIAEILDIVDSPYNSVALSTELLGFNKGTDIPSTIKQFGERISTVNLANFVCREYKMYENTSLFTNNGTLDMYNIVKSLYEYASECYISCDSGRAIWGEKENNTFYDTALGITYVNGLWEAICRSGI